MVKTSKKVTKDPKRQEQGKTSHETHMKRLKKQILEDNQLPTPSPMGSSTPVTHSSTGDPTPSALSSTGGPRPSRPFHDARPNDTYIYDVGIIAILSIGVCVFFAYSTFQPKNPVNKKQD